ncbi:hypothetical protein GLOIN_2v1676043 [Rhizophagus irregularis DAOM 181602=DAOM 197198]|uniref:Uncharacterized protein n=1 Tax=Rhizophagus irregularis (strain DAOM 181602 / DAOM 197198 / MUCL 43194) TaxID=747089 RepID=A0A2P4PG47_RHIID|nr:hypothetical protein GLOIN_2v1676043 [Rhizophagus irregularis DAOM 181602=DAOM 197198]POG64369.1 hypothetical protein GLOIN_2v1676043 [Rhizophagus irregularis DAOM 181602=DAOM 197198]|eukprot:XP_025171235.1 hypothetical protein GLOIN_2v1676043 [Rhizophagus irregularis DAOM 181602=DAOM 197198]
MNVIEKMVYVNFVSSLKLILIIVGHVIHNIFNKISKIGQVEIMLLMNLFKKHN